MTDYAQSVAIILLGAANTLMGLSLLRAFQRIDRLETDAARGPTRGGPR